MLDGGERGEVVAIGVRSTRIRTRDDVQITIPNSIVAEPEPRVRFRAFGDSALNFELLAWAKEPALRGRTIHEMNCEIYKEFLRLGIRIPFSQRDVHVRPIDPGPRERLKPGNAPVDS